MAENHEYIFSELHDRLQDELNQYNTEHCIEYLKYKVRDAYDFVSERKIYESEFYHFPVEESGIIDNIQILHSFYENDVWGHLGPVRIGEDKLEGSKIAIQNKTALDRSIYIYIQKVSGKIR